MRKYVRPELDVIEFDVIDVIASSSFSGGSGGSGGSSGSGDPGGSGGSGTPDGSATDTALGGFSDFDNVLPGGYF